MRARKKLCRRKAKSVIAVILLCGLLCTLVIGYDYAYSLYTSNRPQSEYFVYKPLSGKLWEIDPSNIKGIHIHQMDDQRFPLRLDVYDPERIEAIVDLLNSYRFFFWLPVLDERAFAFGGRQVEVTVKTLHGGSTHLVEDLCFWIREDGFMYFNGIIYFSNRRFYNELEELREKYNETRYVPIDQRGAP